MKVLTIAACILYTSLNTAHAQQTRVYTTYIGGKAELVEQWTVSFKSYPKLDHLFLEGTGAATNADYLQPRNIPKYVVDDIAAWIKKQ